MKKILATLMAVLMLVSVLAIVSCGDSDGASKNESTRMTIDINPSIELMLDAENKVVSVTALNDDGAILIAGEAIVGKSAEEATALIIQLASDTGYLVQGERAENEVKLSVSGDNKALEGTIKTKIESKLGELDIEGTITDVAALDIDELRLLVADNSEYTEDELVDKTEGELYKELSLARVESALFLTDEMRKIYYDAKTHEISFAQREQTAQIIDDMGVIYEVANTAYKTILVTYSNTISQIDAYRYDNLISPDCPYRKGLNAMRDAKAELVQKKNELAAIDSESAEYEAKLEELAALEIEYQKAIESYEGIGEAINEYVDTLISELRAIEAELVKLEANFSDDIKSQLEAKATELEASVNSAKDSFFSEFEAEHRADIESIENELKARKQALIEANSNSVA